MKKALTEYTDRELLKLFADKFNKYDYLRDDELNFLSDHPNRDCWDDEQVKEYDELVDDVIAAGTELNEIAAFIFNLG